MTVGIWFTHREGLSISVTKMFIVIWFSGRIQLKVILEFFSNLNDSRKGRNYLGRQRGKPSLWQCPSVQTFEFLRKTKHLHQWEKSQWDSVQECDFFFPISSPAQLLAMFQNLLERPVMAAVAADKVPVLLSMFSSALDQARLTYSRHSQAGLQLGGCLVRRETDFTGNWI